MTKSPCLGRIRAAWRTLAAATVLAALAGTAAAETPATSNGTETEAKPAANAPPEALDPAAVAAREVLERHCARCHQSGKLVTAAPAADFANVLELDELARDPALVLPGNPDGSSLYVSMLRRTMPPDRHEGPAGAGS